MIRSKKKRSQYHDNDGNWRPLTPLEQTVLEAFNRADNPDSRLHDDWTVGSFLNGNMAFPQATYNACERLAKIVLVDLEQMGYIVRDRHGWYTLASNPPITTTAADSTPLADTEVHP